MPAMSPVVEEFYNKNHSSKDGKFSSGSGGKARAALVKVHGERVADNLINAIGKPHPGIKPTVAAQPRTKGRAGSTPEQYKANQALLTKTRAKVQKRLAKKHMWDAKEKSVKDEMYGDRKHLYDDPEMYSATVMEFYNHVHGKGGRFASSGRAAQGRAGFREGTAGKGRKATTGVSKSGAHPMTSYPSGPVTLSGPARYTSKGPAVRKGFNKIIAARRAGTTSAVHKKTDFQQGEVYTSLKGSHTIRKTKDGKFVLHSKNEAPQRVSKVGADHVKALDARKPTVADVIAGRVHRILAKG